jgi:membrane fusion protein (multidrug efflux system)
MSEQNDSRSEADADRNKNERPKGDAADAQDKGRNGGSDGNGEDEEREDKPSPLKNPKVRFALIVFAVVVLIGGLAWFFHYWTRGRYEQSTNDAYLQADIVTIAPKVAGYVDQVLVQDNQWVRAGQPLVKIDEREVRARLEQAQGQVEQGLASIVQAEAQIRQQQAQILAAQGQLAGSRASAFYAQRQVERYAPLTAQGAQTAEQLDMMRQNRDQAAAQVQANAGQTLSARRQIDVLRAQIGSACAQVDQARAQVRQANVDLQSTLVRSSIAGRVGDRTVRVGQYVQSGARMLSVVPTDRIYLVANFKETQIGLMRIGQPATITVDAISGGEFHGTVESFSPGTGAQFAILPPQNATGNFTKVVQRVPVRIRVEAGPEARKVLVPGLSVTVVVDTIGAKAEKERIEDEAKRTEERRKQEHEAAIHRDRERQGGGAGQ